MLENIPRILPENTAAQIREGSWQVLPIFDVISYIGNVAHQEMYRTFNMGIGMVMICDVPKETIDKALALINHGPVVELVKLFPEKKRFTYYE